MQRVFKKISKTYWQCKIEQLILGIFLGVIRFCIFFLSLCLVEIPTILAQAAKRKRHRQNGLNNTNLFSPSSGGWKFKIKVEAAWFLVRPLFPAC